jgi:hypothetical protein
MKSTITKLRSRFAVGALIATVLISNVKADGITGINAAGSELVTYLDPISTLILAIGAVVGLIGGIRVFVIWNSGERDINKEIMGWFGSCIFLVLVSVVIKAFFV